MDGHHKEWNAAKDELVDAIVELGFPEEFGLEIAKNLGAPSAMHRMTVYLGYEKPKDPETIVDEMLAIRSEIDTWKNKKKSEEANAKYNDLMRHGFDGYDKNRWWKRCTPTVITYRVTGAPIINVNTDAFYEVN